MKLTEEIKQAIIDEYNAFKAKMYKGKSKEERAELDQFFTPPEYTIPMIERMDCDSLEDKKILDPTCGSGNLLVACLIAGAQPCNIYGNDYDEKMVKLCRKRLYNVQNNLFGRVVYQHLEQHIHWGNALQALCLTEFNKKYDDYYVSAVKKHPALLDDLRFAQKLNKIDDNNPYGIPSEYLYEEVPLWD